jgi:hypothetical protein
MVQIGSKYDLAKEPAPKPTGNLRADMHARIITVFVCVYHGFETEIVRVKRVFEQFYEKICYKYE